MNDTNDAPDLPPDTELVDANARRRRVLAQVFPKWTAYTDDLVTPVNEIISFRWDGSPDSPEAVVVEGWCLRKCIEWWWSVDPWHNRKHMTICELGTATHLSFSASFLDAFVDACIGAGKATEEG